MRSHHISFPFWGPEVVSNILEHSWQGGKMPAHSFSERVCNHVSVLTVSLFASAPKDKPSMVLQLK